MILLGIDPGTTTGWALIELEERRIRPKGFGVTKDMTLLEIEEYFIQADKVICETWETRPDYARRGAFDYDSMPAPQVYGAVRTLTAIHKKELVPQSSSLKPVAYGYIGKKYQKGKPNMHKWDALAHAAYHAVTRLNALPVSV